MAKSSTLTNKGIPSLALSLIDLRAHFEAQLRTVARAEEALLKCQAAADRVALDAATSALRDQIENVSDDDRSVRVLIDRLKSDARAWARSAAR